MSPNFSNVTYVMSPIFFWTANGKCFCQHVRSSPNQKYFLFCVCAHFLKLAQTHAYMYTHIHTCAYTCDSKFVRANALASLEHSIIKEPYISAKVRLVYLSAQDPSISAKEPYISAKEPYISAKEPYISAKEPYISANEPYISAKDPHISAKALTYLQTHLHRASNQSRTSLMYLQKSPVYISAENPCISVKEPCVSAKEPYISAKDPHTSAKEPYISANTLSSLEQSIIPARARTHTCAHAYTHTTHTHAHALIHQAI